MDPTPIELKQDLSANDIHVEDSPQVNTTFPLDNHHTKSDALGIIRSSIEMADQLIQQAEAISSQESQAPIKTMRLLRERLRDIHDRIRRLPLTAERKLNNLREDCRALEREMNIHSLADRMAEARLFIDEPFLKVAALRGDMYPEELFGIDAWKGWLTARLRSRRITKMTIDEISLLHRDLAMGMADCRPGEIRTTERIGGSYTNLGDPILLDDKALESIHKNPFIRFCPTSDTGNVGYIQYPSVAEPEWLDTLIKDLPQDAQQRIKAAGSNQVLLQELLAEVLHNSKFVPDEYSDPIRTAALFQRDFVSIHPFEDCNGRLSRLLMNWFLEQYHFEPRAPTEFENDLFIDSEEWISRVSNGTLAHERLNHTKKEPTTPAECFFHQDYIEFYRQCYAKYFAKAPPSNLEMKHDEYRGFLEAFIAECRKFEYFAGADYLENPQTLAEGASLHIGGLIPEDYIQIWGDTRPHIQKEIRSAYCQEDVTVYRGGELQVTPQSPRDLLSFFLHPLAITASYGPLFKDGVSPKSLVPIKRSEIVKMMRLYNRILLNDYLVSRHKAGEQHQLAAGERGRVAAILGNDNNIAMITIEEVTRTLAEAVNDGAYLPYILTTHYEGELESSFTASPAVSTSLTREAAEIFSHKEAGVLITALAPEWGAMYLPRAGLLASFKDANFKYKHCDENEMSVMGGLDPNSITQVSLMRYEIEQARATRNNETGEITLYDFIKNVIEVYVFNEQGLLVLKSRENYDVVIPEDPVDSDDDDGGRTFDPVDDEE